MSLSIRLEGTTASILLLFLFQPLEAEEMPDFTLKPHGVSLEVLTQEQDLEITDLKLALPGINDTLLSSIKSQTTAADKAQAANVRLDYQVNPHLNVFGSAGNLQSKVKINFSKLGMGLPRATAYKFALKQCS